MAVRLARAVTEWEHIVVHKNDYHGWNDWTIARTNPGYGIVECDKDLVHEAEWGDLSAYDNLPSESIAAIVFEHPSMDADPEWYEYMQQMAIDEGAFLIADEIVTGLRYGLGGACGKFGINPDLICIGKALGNGFPINAVVGPAEYLDWFNRVDPVFCSSTHWGETASLYAANYVLDNWDQDCVDDIWETGGNLIVRLKDAGWDVFGHPPRSVLRFKDEKERAFFVHYMFENGILMNRPNFPNLCHTLDDVMLTWEVATRARERYNNMSQKELDEYVAGRMPRVLFSNR